MTLLMTDCRDMCWGLGVSTIWQLILSPDHHGWMWMTCIFPATGWAYGEYGGHRRDEFGIFYDGKSLWLMGKVLKIVVKWNLSQLGYLKNWSQPANMAGNGNFMSIRTLFMNNAIQFCCRGNFSRPYVIATWVWDMSIIGSPPNVSCLSSNYIANCHE